MQTTKLENILPLSPTFNESKSVHTSPSRVDDTQSSLFLKKESAVVSRSIRTGNPDTIPPLQSEAGFSPILTDKKRKLDNVIKRRLNSEQVILPPSASDFHYDGSTFKIFFFRRQPNISSRAEQQHFTSDVCITF